MKLNVLSHQFSPDLPGSEVSPILPSSSVVGSATWQVEERVHEVYTVTSMVPHHSGNVTALPPSDGHPTILTVVDLFSKVATSSHFPSSPLL